MMQLIPSKMFLQHFTTMQFWTNLNLLAIFIHTKFNFRRWFLRIRFWNMSWKLIFKIFLTKTLFIGPSKDTCQIIKNVARRSCTSLTNLNVFRCNLLYHNGPPFVHLTVPPSTSETRLPLVKCKQNLDSSETMMYLQCACWWRPNDLILPTVVRGACVPQSDNIPLKGHVDFRPKLYPVSYRWRRKSHFCGSPDIFSQFWCRH